MAQIETWLNQDMMQAVKVRYLDGNLFSQDNAGNLIGVKLTRDGEDYSGGGTVSANVIRADGGTVAVTGALSGNVATVVLPQSAYAVPGVVSIVVKLTVSGAIITIAAVVANIYQSSTETAIDPGTIIPSIQTLINQINTAVASIPADYSSLWATLAPAFSTSTAYTIGQYVTYDGGLYRFTSAHPAGAWSASDATAAVVGGVLTDLQTGKADKTDPVFYGTISKGRKGNSQTGTGSVALGDNVTANGWFSQAEGQGTIANGSYQRASGKYNVADTGNTYAEMVGNGYAEVDPQTFVVTEHRSNARTLDWNGNERLAGDLYVGCNDDSTGGSKVAKITDVIGKQDAPETAGTAGQVLGLDSNLDPVWLNQQGGGGGAVDDVQINGTSIVNQGVANLPLAGNSALGVVKTQNNYGILVHSTEGRIYIDSANSTVVKAGTDQFRPIVPYRQDAAAFYGLAKAAGADMKDISSTTVGTYPEAQKSAISQMLDAPETVSGTTPSITAKAGVRYICGEVSTLTIVAPASGCIDVTFTSGATATVLTVTPPTGMTMKWANGFDPTSLDANTTYEINIMDGKYGVVGKWT